MDVATPPQSRPDSRPDTTQQVPADRLAAEVRESALLLLMSVAVTVGLASAAQALLAALG